MRRFTILVLTVGLLAALPAGMTAARADIPASAEIAGSLVMVGGSLGASTREVYGSFISLAGGKENARIGIVPAASGSLTSSTEFSKTLTAYGVPTERIGVLPISDHDFSGTAFDESTWKTNAKDPRIADAVRGLTGIWFVGGDQARITAALRSPDGTNTPVLDAIWDVYQRGAVIGGTSAGAAIMSETMLTGGDSLAGLRGQFAPDGTSAAPAQRAGEVEPVTTARGLGFFRFGTVDQHFDERARLGRLVGVAMNGDGKDVHGLSYGIDEDTALIVNNRERTATIAGRGGVTVVDTRDARRTGRSISNVSTSFLSPGDSIDLTSRSFAIAAGKDATKGYEYNEFAPLPAAGMLTPYGRLKPYLAYSLVDNTTTASVKSYLYDSRGDGFTLTFSKAEETNGYYRSTDGSKDDYSIAHVRMDVSPSTFDFRKDPRAFGEYQRSRFVVPPVVDRGPIKGHLVVAGGALGSSNADVYKKFIVLAGGNRTARVGIVPAASSSLKSSEAFKRDLIGYGLAPENIEILPLSTHDFKGTTEDESAWAGNRDSDAVASKIRNLDAVWFVGGDQTRITSALFDPDHSESKALKAIWGIYSDGAVLGGTSAGAAIMSDVMLAGGGSLDTLSRGFTDTYDGMVQQEGGPAYLERGLGFFRYGILDQHFDKKSRLGRLIVTAHEKGDPGQLSYGIDEDTALVVDNVHQKVGVVGRGGVTVVDLSQAKTSPAAQSQFRDVLVSTITPGDEVDLRTRKIHIRADKQLTTGREYGSFAALPYSGVLTAHGALASFLGYNLIDNAGQKSVKSYSFDRGRGVELTFRKVRGTAGYWGTKDGGKDDYSAVNVALDIDPVAVTVASPNS